MEIEVKKERYDSKKARVGDMLKRAGLDAACRALKKKKKKDEEEEEKKTKKWYWFNRPLAEIKLS